MEEKEQVLWHLEWIIVDLRTGNRTETRGYDYTRKYHCVENYFKLVEYSKSAKNYKISHLRMYRNNTDYTKTLLKFLKEDN